MQGVSSGRLRRLAVTLCGLAVAAGGVAGAVSAAPDAESDLSARAGTDIEKFAGIWTEIDPATGDPVGPEGSLRLTGTEVLKGNDKLKGLLDYGGVEFCPDDPGADTATKAKIPEQGKKFDPSDGKEGYNAKSGGATEDSDPQAGDYAAQVEKQDSSHGPVQILQGSGDNPACNLDAAYSVIGAFSKDGKHDGWLFPKFEGQLLSSDGTGDSTLMLEAEETK